MYMDILYEHVCECVHNGHLHRIKCFSESKQHFECPLLYLMKLNFIITSIEIVNSTSKQQHESATPFTLAYHLTGRKRLCYLLHTSVSVLHNSDRFIFYSQSVSQESQRPNSWKYKCDSIKCQIMKLNYPPPPELSLNELNRKCFPFTRVFCQATYLLHCSATKAGCYISSGSSFCWLRIWHAGN